MGRVRRPVRLAPNPTSDDPNRVWSYLLDADGNELTYAMIIEDLNSIGNEYTVTKEKELEVKR